MTTLKQFEDFVHFSKYRIVQYLQVCVLVDKLVDVLGEFDLFTKISVSVSICECLVNSSQPKPSPFINTKRCRKIFSDKSKIAKRLRVLGNHLIRDLKNLTQCPQSL